MAICLEEAKKRRGKQGEKRNVRRNSYELIWKMEITEVQTLNDGVIDEHELDISAEELKTLQATDHTLRSVWDVVRLVRLSKELGSLPVIPTVGTL